MGFCEVGGGSLAVLGFLWVGMGIAIAPTVALIYQEKGKHPAIGFICGVVFAPIFALVALYHCFKGE